MQEVLQKWREHDNDMQRQGFWGNGKRIGENSYKGE